MRSSTAIPARWRWRQLEPLLDRLDLITCNHLEAQALTQVKVDGPAKLISAALILVKQGVKRAVVTFGARGLAYADEERSLYQPARSANLSMRPAPGTRWRRR